MSLSIKKFNLEKEKIFSVKKKNLPLVEPQEENIDMQTIYKRIKSNSDFHSHTKRSFSIQPLPFYNPEKNDITHEQKIQKEAKIFKTYEDAFEKDSLRVPKYNDPSSERKINESEPIYEKSL